MSESSTHLTPTMQARRSVYPVRVDARLDPGLSRWLWLVKWILVIPHMIVLAVLWLCFAVATFVAGVAVLITGRYPRALFDFDVGVLRWSWRVTCYAFLFTTDRYPPFSLRSDPDYPADLAVDYPQRLSRPLVLVKWWLLALPHYLIIGLVTGNVAWIGWQAPFDEHVRIQPGISLLGALTLVAGVMLLVTTAYPKPLFDILVGAHRWTNRVCAYAALMRDEYPPFRLDQGGTDPASEPMRAEAEPPVLPEGRSGVTSEERHV